MVNCWRGGVRGKVDYFVFLLIFFVASLSCAPFGLRSDEKLTRVKIVYSGSTRGHVKPCPT